MKKSKDSSDLAARLAAAASQPVGAKSVPPATPVLVSPATEAKAPAAVPARSKAKKIKPEPDTVPITLRPSSALLTKYVLKASERTREGGRVISVQQIMLEVLERGVS